ncbi:hypothetical protein Pse7429DRAFT_0992 [Pseudanabaena biceps PCC 7429]|uniref:Uncharacterized protein n=1 Tax=Pseudanabaena biceps PCC 7429 TaxID=927668 RepID=L8N2J3_9CYAN|nr:hypothetical protein Pse7429DRAFT_0992 [Pseudanabaena biceps PCC 7429]
MGLIKYKTLKPAAHAQRTPQVLDLDFNYAEVLITSITLL